MASISKDANGTKRLLFYDHQGKRRAVRLGAVTMKQAEMAKSKVESIVSAKIIGVTFDAEISRWLLDISDDIHSKLANTGIISPRLKITLGEYCKRFLARTKARAYQK